MKAHDTGCGTCRVQTLAVAPTLGVKEASMRLWGVLNDVKDAHHRGGHDIECVTKACGMCVCM